MPFRSTVLLILASFTLVMAPAALVAEDKDDEERSSLAFGIKGLVGAGYPNYSDFPAKVTTTPSISWSIGGFMQWTGYGVVSGALQPEIAYVREEGVSTILASDNGDVSFDITTVVQSIRLPILGKLQFFDPLVVQPSVYAGPSFSYVLSAENVVSGREYDIEGNNFHVGLTVGVDVTILSFLVVDVRYNTNFTSMTSSITEIANNVNLTTGSLLAGLAFRF